MRRWGLIAAALLLSACAHQAPPASPPQADAIGTEYDLIYAISHGRMSTAPSPFLVSTMSALPRPGAGATALDIGGGAGRNSLWLAHHGYRVTDVDLSRVGLDLARQQAEVEHVPVTTAAADINQFDLGQERWNVIALIDFPFPTQALLPRIAAALKPGGVVVIQAVSVRQPGSESPDYSLRYTYLDRRALDAPFAGFHILHDSQGLEPTVWGVKAIMIRYAARKP